MKHNSKKRDWILRLCIAGPLMATSALFAQVIPSERAFTNGWRNAGYVGAIPAPARIVNVRDYGAQGNGTANDAPAINAAKTALGASGGVIYFPAGTYAVPNNAITLSSNIVLRGERSYNTTILATNLLVTQTPTLYVLGSAPTAPWMNILSGYDLNSWSVNLADVSSFSPGDWVETHQGTNTAWKMSAWPDMIGQILRVAAVTTTVPPAGTLTFVTPLRLQYEADLPLSGIPIKPQIRRFNRAVSNVGIENLRFSRVIAGDNAMRNNVPHVYFRFAVNSWVRGCEFTNVFGSAISGDYSANIEVTGNYIHHAYEFDGSGSGYGVALQYRCSEFLVENNIFERLRHSMLVQAGVNGNVFGYNYSRDQYKDESGIRGNFVSDMTCHGNYTYGNLFEGNCGAYAAIDSTHGMNGPYNTFFRNRARGTSLKNALEITDTLTSNPTFVGNEAIGSYSIAKTGVFQYGNNDDGVIQPSGTGVLPDYSYYMGNCVTSPPPLPEWWNISQTLPVYGPQPDGSLPPIGTERDIPARARYFASGTMTYAPPSLYRQPTNRVVNQWEPAIFEVAAVGESDISFQWHRDGSPIPNATNAILTISSANMPDAGVYQALIHDRGGWISSVSATLTVQRVAFSVTASAGSHGVMTPAGSLATYYGDTNHYLITANASHYIAGIYTNGMPVAGAAGQTAFELLWGPLYSSSTVDVSFASNALHHATPEAWLVQNGFTGADFNVAADMDEDKDGHPNWMEFFAGTDPRNPASVLSITQGDFANSGESAGEWRMLWPSVSNKFYTVLRSTNLASGFDIIASNLQARPPTNEFIYSDETSPSAFYRIKLE